MKTYSFRELVKRPRKHDRRFEVESGRGKGSHRTIVHPDVGGRSRSFTLPCHSEGADVKRAYLPRLRETFELPDDIFD